MRVETHRRTAAIVSVKSYQSPELGQWTIGVDRSAVKGASARRAGIPGKFAQFVGLTILTSCVTRIMRKNAVEYAISRQKNSTFF